MKTTFSKIVALNAFEGHIRYEGDKIYQLYGRKTLAYVVNMIE